MTHPIEKLRIDNVSDSTERGQPITVLECTVLHSENPMRVGAMRVVRLRHPRGPLSETALEVESRQGWTRQQRINMREHEDKQRNRLLAVLNTALAGSRVVVVDEANNDMWVSK